MCVCVSVCLMKSVFVSDTGSCVSFASIPWHSLHYATRVGSSGRLPQLGCCCFPITAPLLLLSLLAVALSLRARPHASLAVFWAPPPPTCRFAFDNVFDEAATQDQVYTLLGQPLLTKAFAGFNGTIFAYGQTGSGKVLWGLLVFWW